MSVDVKENSIIKKQISDVEWVINIHLDLLKEFPDDKVIKMSLEQYKQILKELLDEIQSTHDKKSK